MERGPGLENARSIHPAFAVIYTLIIFALIYNTVFSLFYSTAQRPSHAPSCRLTRPWWKELSGAGKRPPSSRSLEAHPRRVIGEPLCL